MTLKINFLKKANNDNNNIVLFCDEKLNLNSIKKFINSSEFSYINELIKNCDLKKNLFIFEINSKKKKLF